MPRVVWMLTLSAFFVAIGFGVMIPVLPLFARSFGVSNLLIGLVVSAFAGMRLATSPFCRRISDRIGHRRTIGIGMWIVAVSSALCGIAGSYPELLWWRAVGGIGSAMFTISATALLLASVPAGLRGRAAGLYQGSFLIGGMAGPAVGGLLAGISITAPFFFYAGTLLVAGTIAFTQLHEPASLRKAGPEEITRPLREVLADTRFQAACLLSFGQGWQSFGVRSALVPILIWLVVLLCVYGVGAAALGTAPTAALGDAARGAGSQPIAIHSMSSDVGAILGPVAAGLLADSLGMTAAFASGAVILLAGAGLSWFMPSERREEGTPPRA